MDVASFIARAFSDSPMSVRRSSRGLSLLEMMMVTVITIILFGITHLILMRTIESWWRVNASADSEQQLYRAQQSLERDLRSAAFELQPDRRTINVERAPAELNNLSGADGDVLWFLSAIDPVTGKFCRNADGTPFWQRNIVYYLVTPKNSHLHFGYDAAGLAQAGYEVACPYKVLIRKEIDSGVPTHLSDSSSIEKLLTYSELAPYLDRPDGYSCAGMSGVNTAVKPVSANLLSFRAELQDQLRGVSLDLRATAIERARREGGIGSRDLISQPATTQLRFVVMPPNGPPSPNP